MVGYSRDEPQPNFEVEFDHPLVERSILRYNLLSRYGYAPYCGNARCNRRVIYDMKTGVATCECCWKSTPLTKEFIDLFNQVWSKGTSNE